MAGATQCTGLYVVKPLPFGIQHRIARLVYQEHSKLPNENLAKLHSAGLAGRRNETDDMKQLIYSGH